MKLKTFDTTNCRHARKTSPVIALNRKGYNHVYTALCDQLKLKPNDRISFHQDEENPEEWYLSINTKDGFILRPAGNSSRGLLFNSAELAGKILDSADIDANSARVKVIDEPITTGKVKFYPIITAYGKQ